MRFRKSIKITKGVKLNLSKTGVSFTLGTGKGLSFNLGNKGAFLNWSIPGTGVYDRVRLDTKVKDVLSGKGFLGGLFGGKAEAAEDETHEKLPNGKGKKTQTKKAPGVTDEAIAALEQELALINVACFAPDLASAYAQGELDGEDAAAAIEAWLAEAELPIPVEVQMDVCAEKKAILVDLDLPEIEDMPQKKLTELASGEVKIKDKSQKEKREDYQTCVFGLGEFVAANILNIVPAAEKVLLSAYTQRRDAQTGDLNDTFIYSIVFDRAAFAPDYQKTAPAELCGKLKGRFITLSTGVMKAIVPYEASDI
ncbi:MAG: DUF4236 domain-containing protein [Clostridia bacterium]|nr:DUF4236 domain-containing protein [Clostridia bacterium]